jgi:two-component sensor histidine kinase
MGTYERSARAMTERMITNAARIQQTNDVARINLARYAAGLTDEPAHTYGVDPARIALETEPEDVWVGLDTATPCGLLPHELLT